MSIRFQVVGNGSGRCESLKAISFSLPKRSLYIQTDKAILASPPSGGLGLRVERISNTGCDVAGGEFWIRGDRVRMKAESLLGRASDVVLTSLHSNFCSPTSVTMFLCLVLQYESCMPVLCHLLQNGWF